MIRITVKTTTPDGETVERTREYTTYEAAFVYLANCITTGREITKEEETS